LIYKSAALEHLGGRWGRWYGWSPSGGFGGGGVGGGAQNISQSVGTGAADIGPTFAVGEISITARVSVNDPV
jgi:hypothetical protein